MLFVALVLTHITIQRHGLREGFEVVLLKGCHPSRERKTGGMARVPSTKCGVPAPWPRLMRILRPEFACFPEYRLLDPADEANPD
jgi:hypothetical protein